MQKNMVKTSVQLEEELVAAVDRLAHAGRESRAKVIREALRLGLVEKARRQVIIEREMARRRPAENEGGSYEGAGYEGAAAIIRPPRG